MAPRCSRAEPSFPPGSASCLLRPGRLASTTLCTQGRAGAAAAATRPPGCGVQGGMPLGPRGTEGGQLPPGLPSPSGCRMTAGRPAQVLLAVGALWGDQQQCTLWSDFVPVSMDSLDCTPLHPKGNLRCAACRGPGPRGHRWAGGGAACGGGERPAGPVRFCRDSGPAVSGCSRGPWPEHKQRLGPSVSLGVAGGGAARGGRQRGLASEVPRRGLEFASW